MKRIILSLIGLGICIGAVGACEIDAISFGQMLKVCLASSPLIVIGVM